VVVVTPNSTTARIGRRRGSNLRCEFGIAGR
jgi:hypothetical protein